MTPHPVLVQVSAAGCAPFPALLWQEQVLALRAWRDTAGAALQGTDNFAAFVQAWPANEACLRELMQGDDARHVIEARGAPLASMTLHAPVHPRQVYCTIGNYRAQALEAALDADDGPTGPGAPARAAAVRAALEQRVSGGEPYIALKGVGSVCGPFDPLPIADDIQALDWEVEIGVVIGRRARHVSTAQALAHVAGYCLVNDITSRAHIFRSDLKVMGTDWIQSKSRPGWLPVGPWLVPAWDIAQPANLELWLRLNGEVMQRGAVHDMVFGIAEQIAYLSRITVLEPGDLICTGSPAGFGSHHGRYLRPGDVVTAGAGPLGEQRTSCVRAPEPLPCPETT